MAGKIDQGDIEAVFEDVMNDSVEKMSEGDREDARRFHLREAVRFGAVDYLEGRDYIPSRTDEEIEGMNRVEKMFMQQYYLTEAKRFGADESYTIRDPEEEEIRPTPVPVPRRRPRQRPVPAPRRRPTPAPRQTTEQSMNDTRRSIDDDRAENARLVGNNSLRREYLTALREQNELLKEWIRIDDEIAEAEDENTEISLRKEDI